MRAFQNIFISRFNHSSTCQKSSGVTLSRAILLFLIFAFFQSVFSQNALVPFTFSLSTASKTSAGVYKKDGTLIRTLWGGVNFPAGTHTKTWDRKDDEGHMITDTGLVVKVLSNNVNYKWEGVVGNTSDSSHGTSKYRYYYRMESMAIHDSIAYFGTGYGEGGTSSGKFILNKPQQKINIFFHQYGVNLDNNYVATDGNYVYWAGSDPFGGQYWSKAQVSLTYATKVSDDGEVLFANGSPVQMGAGRVYNKAIDIVLNDPNGYPTGLAVQKNGKYLFVSHGRLNKINVLHKTTGAFVRSISMNNPTELCIDKNDDIWIFSGTNTIEKYTVDSATGNISSSSVLSLSGLLDPIAMAVSPNNYQILVIDGGISQQIKAYSNISGDSLWTYGQYGGYATDPLVTNDKFYFTDTGTHMRKQFIAFQPDSSFWVSDGGNERVQHYTASRTYIDNIMYLPCTYSTQVDKNDPTRAFNQYLEFKIDYSKPLAPNNGSWILYKNWKHGLPRSHKSEMYYILQDVVTLSNGRTYATIYDNTNPLIRYPEVVELPDTGNIRLTGIHYGAFARDVLEKDGSILAYQTSTGKNVIDSGYWETKDFKGFDGSNNPLWSKSKKITSISAYNPIDPSYDPKVGDLSFARKTSSDVLVVFNHSLKEGFHLGGVKVGDNKYLWKTAISTYVDYHGVYPSDGKYDLGNGVKVGGGHAYTIEKNIFWNYHGEFWRGSQTNKWSHVYDNGLLISTFGIDLREARTLDWEAPAMGAGNVMSSTIVKVGNDYYLYHNDESVHSGLHRWKITGLNTINEQSVPITFNTFSGGLVSAYFNGVDLNSFNRSTVMVDTIVNLITPPKQISNPSSFSVRWTGFVQPNYSQNYTFYTKVSKGVKLWIDGKLTISQWNNTSLTDYNSAAIKLEAGKKYMIKMEVSGGVAALSWSSNSQTKQIIPSANLYPSDFPSYTTEGIDLMEGLGFKTVLEDNMYGWNRNPAQNYDISDQDNWSAQTSLRSFDRENPDLHIKFMGNKDTNFVSRKLGKAIPCLTSWKINGNINYIENTPTYGAFGGFFDILDDKGKVICRINHTQDFDGKTNPNHIKCNGKPIASGPADLMSLIIGKYQRFEIFSDSTGITFSYANYNPIKVKVFDPNSNWRRPATIKFLFISKGWSPLYTRFVDVEKLKFSAVAPALPEISTSGATQFCEGDSVTLTSTPASTYLWSNNATTQNIKVKNTGNYTVTIKDSKGCPLPSDTTKVLVNPIPVATITASGPTTFCQGDSVVLSASNAASYLWSNNQTTKNVTVKTSGNITLKIKDSKGCTSKTTSVTTTLNTSPAAPTITPNGPTTFCVGNSVVLTASAANTYLWNNNQTTQSITVNSSGNYYVKITNANGCSATSSATTVTVNSSSSTPTITPGGSTTFCSGDSVILTSSNANTYLWSNSETTKSISVKSSGGYSVLTNNGTGCSASSSTTTVTVNALPTAPTITASGATTFCQGDSVTLISSAANTYLWSNNATSQNIKVKATGNYKVKITDGNGCSASSSVTAVTVNALPTAPVITASGATTFCQGDSVTLVSSAANYYLWSNNATSQNIRVKSSGNYKVKITDANGCSASSSVTTVTVNALPTVPTITAGGATTFCQGDSVTLASSAANTYLWSNNVTSQIIRVKSSGNYKVKITDANGCSASSSVTTVTVNALPTVPTITASGTTTFCQGDSVTLASSAANTYLWSNNATSQNIRVKSSGNYKVKITDANGCSASSSNTSVTVNALPAAPTITASGATTFCQGDSVTLVSSTANYYLWSNNATSQNIRVKSSGNYKVKITDANGCSASSSNTSVTVNALPAAPTITSSGATTFCQGDSVTLVSSAANYYLWSNNATSQNIRVKSSGNYKVKITDANGCSASSSVTTVTVNALPTAPTITASGNTTFCQDDSVTLVSSAANYYLWSNNTTSQNIRVKSSGNYKVKITDANGCSASSFVTAVTVNALPIAPTITASGATTFCQGNFITLTSSFGNSYFWNNSATTNRITVNASGNYKVQVTDNNGCSSTSATTAVKVNSLPSIPTITANQSISFCQGDSVKLVSSNSSSYLWSNNAITPSITVKNSGNFSVKVTDANGCSATSAITSVAVQALPKKPIINTNGATVFCQGDSVILSTSKAFSYLWNNNVTSQNNIVKNKGNYNVKITDANGCSSTSDNVSITVNTLPIAEITAPSSTNFCQGDSLLLTSSYGQSYKWSTGETQPSISVNKTGNYFVTIRDVNGCYAISPVMKVKVNPLPAQPQISANGSTSFCEGDSVILSSSAAISYWWNNNSKSQSIVVKSTGTYSVTIMDANHCTATSSSKVVTVYDSPIIPVITIKGNILTSSATSGNQWYFNGNIIVGATSQTYKKTKGGNYTVIVSNSNCASSSALYYVSDLAIDNALNDNKLDIFPNPNEGLFNVRMEKSTNGNIRIFDMAGKLIYNETGPIDRLIDLSGHAYGVYTLQIQTSENTYIERVVIQ